MEREKKKIEKNFQKIEHEEKIPKFSQKYSQLLSGKNLHFESFPKFFLRHFPPMQLLKLQFPSLSKSLLLFQSPGG